MDSFSDKVLESAFSGNWQPLATIGQRPFEDISAELLEDVISNPRFAVAGIRLATCLACLPSLQTVARSEGHTQDTAVAVSDNLQFLSDTILATPELESAALESFGREIQGRVRGQLGETAVLGLIWWSTAHDLRDPRTYALPTTRQEDDGGPRRDGYKVGADIIMRVNGHGNKQLIQVKASAPPEEQIAINRYHPDVAVVVIKDLLADYHSGPRGLLRILQTDDRDQLVVINERLEQRLQHTRDRSQYYKTYRAREKAKHVARQPTRTRKPRK